MLSHPRTLSLGVHPRSPLLLPCFTQSRLEAVFNLVPARFLRLGTLFDRRAVLFDLGRGCLVLTPCGFERGLGFCHSRMTACAGLGRRSLFFLALPLPPLPFSFISECGLARFLFVSLSRLRYSLAARNFAFTRTCIQGLKRRQIGMLAKGLIGANGPSQNDPRALPSRPQLPRCHPFLLRSPDEISSVCCPRHQAPPSLMAWRRQDRRSPVMSDMSSASSFGSSKPWPEQSVRAVDGRAFNRPRD